MDSEIEGTKLRREEGTVRITHWSQNEQYSVREVRFSLCMAFYPRKPFFSIVELNDSDLHFRSKDNEEINELNDGAHGDAATQPLQLFVILARIAITRGARYWTSIMDEVEQRTSTNVCVSFTYWQYGG
jgi:hypothetical protein